MRLRKSLGNLECLVVAYADFVELKIDGAEIDTDHFEIISRRSRDKSLPVSVPDLRYAISLSRRPFMEGAEEPWIEQERQRFLGSRHVLLVTLGQQFSTQMQYDEAYLLAREAVELFPNRESGHLLLMSVLKDSGQTAEALAHFAELKQRSGQDILGYRATSLSREIQSAEKKLQPTKLPLPGKTFGRQNEQNRLKEWLDPESGLARLVTLLGPGGIGKTRLLIQTCHQLSCKYLGQVQFVDLSEVTKGSLVPVAILRAMNTEYMGTNDPLSRLSAAIPNHPFLLALDNLEQLADSISEVVVRLLDDNPHLRIVASSRIALNLIQEHKLPIYPLELPGANANWEEAKESPSAKLFIQLLESSGHCPVIRESDQIPLVQLVRTLEGIPLGITLAAPRVRTHGISGVLNSLSESQLNLTTSAKGIPERH